jgi:hypothetical protein
MAKKKWKPHFHSDEATVQPPKYWPGDPVMLDDGTHAIVEYARRDGQVCLMLPSGRREWQHEDCLRWPASFQPTRRR